ncbi:hypothetical protein NDA11_007834 [Ustilago hordei]|nr:hypothetical protein NDA12_001785 [Ustilago hordei]KAJ1593363.1 hypothetical protein NDA11_007834 [Ustilago hordei]
MRTGLAGDVVVDCAGGMEFADDVRCGIVGTKETGTSDWSLIPRWNSSGRNAEKNVGFLVAFARVTQHLT